MSRKDLDIDQRELGRRVGVSNTYISNIERGYSKNVTADVLVKLAEALGVSVTYLLGLTDAPGGSADDGAPIDAGPNRLVFEVRDAELRAAVLEIIDVVREMTPAQRRLFVDMAQKMKRLMDGEENHAPIIIE